MGVVVSLSLGGRDVLPTLMTILLFGLVMVYAVPLVVYVLGVTFSSAARMICSASESYVTQSIQGSYGEFEVCAPLPSNQFLRSVVQAVFPLFVGLVFALSRVEVVVAALAIALVTMGYRMRQV
ncbi:MAG: hypothetical protein QXK45_07195 [Thermofilaceae archaeon]